MLLNVFASWCATLPGRACRCCCACKRRRRDRSMASPGRKSAPGDSASAGSAEFGDPYIRVRRGSHRSGTGIELGVAGVPETFVIDKQGRIRYRHVGALTPEDWEAQGRAADGHS